MGCECVGEVGTEGVGVWGVCGGGETGKQCMVMAACGHGGFRTEVERATLSC